MGKIFFLCSLIIFISLTLVMPYGICAETAQSYYSRAKQFDAQGKTEDAIAESKKALELDPNFGKAHLMLGVCYSRKQMHRPAILEYQKALSLNIDIGNQAVAHHNLGAEYEFLGDREKAEAEFREALRLDPNFPEPKVALRKSLISKIISLVPEQYFVGILIAVFVLLAVFIGVIASFLQYIRFCKPLKNLAESFHGYIPKVSFYPTVNGEYLGMKFSISLLPSSRNSPSYLRISLTRSSFLKLKIYRESFLSNISKKLGLIHEVKIQDENFNKNFLIFSNRADEAAAYLNNTNIKDAAKGIFDSGFETLIINGKNVLIQKPNYELYIDLQTYKIMDILQKLNIVTRGLYVR